VEHVASFPPSVKRFLEFLEVTLIKFIVMKKMLVLIAFMAIVSAGAIAQNQRSQNQRSQDQTRAQQHPQREARDKAEWDRKIISELKLTQEQQTKYHDISREYDQQIDALKNDQSLTNEARKQRKMALKQEKMDKVNEILTPDQQARYKEMIDKKMKKENNKSDRY
jgi:Spy/CpxP family protein refolding chaperone